MADDFEEPTYSAFWPVLIFLIAFAFSSFYQIYEVVVQRNAVNSRYDLESPNIQKAAAAQNRLVALINDLVATSAKDPNASQIIQEAKQAGILRDNPNATGTGGGVAPAPAATQ